MVCYLWKLFNIAVVARKQPQKNINKCMWQCPSQTLFTKGAAEILWFVSWSMANAIKMYLCHYTQWTE